MNYSETLEWLFNQFPAYQNIGKKAYKADLSSSIALATHLGNPHQKIKTIHVAGTNGKGSSSHMLASVLQAAGYKVGLYTSPHLKDFRERIKINGVMIPKNYVVRFVADNIVFFKEKSLSFFEMTVGMAFEYFATQKVDVAIIEVGLGGRLDATNIITPEVSLITNIGKDHTNFLGNDLESIAAEKAGVIKPSVPVVISETQEKIEALFIAIAKRNSARITFADQLDLPTYTTDLLGEYQLKNMRGVVAVLEQLKGFKIDENHMVNGLKNVVKNTGLQGRWQVLQNKPLVVCDTAHNKEGLCLTMQQVALQNYDNLHIVFGVVADKDLLKILPLLPKEAQYYFCAPNNKRALQAKVLKEEAKKYGLYGNCYNSVNEAFIVAKNSAIETDFIYVGGSTFVVAEIL